MAYTIIDPQPSLRAAELAFDDIGPGLYDDGEVLIMIDTNYAAVSVDTSWLTNGAGVAFTATARWCDDTGQTQLCPNGCHVETLFSYTADPATVNTHGVTALAKDMLLLVLGEDTILLNDESLPVINVPTEVKLNISIRNAISTVEGTASLVDSKTLLS